MAYTGTNWMRLRGLLRKEMIQILRDPSSILLVLVMPVVVLFLEGTGVNLDPENVPVAVVLENNTPLARDIMARFEGSRFFLVTQVRNRHTALNLMKSHAVDGIVTVRGNLETELIRDGAETLQVVVNGVDSNQARLIQGYTRGALQNWLQVRRASGQSAAVPKVVVEPRIWFNPTGRSTNTIIPGLIAVIMTLTGTLLTSLVIAREWERGTMEAMLATPLRTGELLIGKTVPYFVLGMMGMGITVLAALFLFDVPFRGSPAALALVGGMFMLASLSLGLAFSAAIRVQFVAAQAGILAGFLPAVFLSGMLFDLESTPRMIRMVSYLVPARYFVSASHTLFLAGDVWPVLLPDAGMLLLMSIVFLAITRRNLGKHLA